MPRLTFGFFLSDLVDLSYSITPKQDINQEWKDQKKDLKDILKKDKKKERDVTILDAKDMKKDNFMEKKMNGTALYQCFNHFWTIEGRKAESKPNSTKFGIEIKQFKEDVITHSRCNKGMSYEIILV